MINKKKKKGFTIVELVIVIVIIGVLAAVLIPTFGSLIKKANESADKQTVYQMNIIIAAESVENGELSVSDVIDILAENGFDTTDLNPTSEDLKFKWDDDNKVVILVRPGENDSFEQIYPVVDGGNTSSNVVDLKKPDPAEVFKAALLAGGTVELSQDTTLDESISLPVGTTIDLNNKTLTLGINVSFTVGSNAEASTLSEGECDVIIKNGTVQISPAYTDEEYEFYSNLSEEDVDNMSPEQQAEYNDFMNRYYYPSPGIKIEANGSLKLESVTIEGNRSVDDASIDNEGFIHLIDTEIVAKAGIGLRNKGEATIEGGEFIASGYNASPICCYSGEMGITGSTFIEGESFESYYSQTPIIVFGGEVTVGNVTVTTSTTYSIYASDGQVIINSGNINKKLLLLSSGADPDITSITIYGGTINSINYEDIVEDSGIFGGAGFDLNPGENCWIISKSTD